MQIDTAYAYIHGNGPVDELVKMIREHLDTPLPGLEVELTPDGIILDGHRAEWLKEISWDELITEFIDNEDEPGRYNRLIANLQRAIERLEASEDES